MPQKYKYCSVFECKNSNKKISNELNEKHFFHFPRNNERNYLWRQFCRNPTLDGLKNANLISHRMICSDHFKVSDFKIGNKVGLTNNAVPSIRKNIDINVNSSSSKTILKLGNEQIVRLVNHQSKSPSLHTPSLDKSSLSKNNYHSNSQSCPSTSACVFSNLSDINTENCSSPYNSQKSNIQTLTKIGVKVKKELQSSPIKKMLYYYAKKQEMKIRRLKKKYAKTKVQKLSRKKINSFNINYLNEVSEISKGLTPNALTLLVSQIKCASRKPKGRRWLINEKILALSIYKKGPKVYRLLRCLITLPSERTLRKLLSSLPISTGINKRVIENLTSTVSEMEERDKYCVLMFDEMSIRPNLSYDPTNDHIVGVEDQGEKGRSNNLATYALVFMVCGIFKRWKQPIAFYFSGKKGVKAETLIFHLKCVISACSEAGLCILATVCDMGSTFVQAIKQLGSTTLSPKFSFEGKDIITIFDPPHLIKCTRNMLKKHDIKIKVKTNSLEYDGIASWTHIEEVYNRDKQAGTFRWLWKLSDSHLNPLFRKKIKVKLATQVLSHSVAAAIMKDVSIGLMDSTAIATAHFVEMCDKLFDSFNGVTEKGEQGKEMRCQITSTSPHHKFWDEIYNWIDGWKFKSPKPNREFFRPPSQNGWLMTIRGMEQLWREIYKLNNKGIVVNFLVPRGVNQDPLENAFSSIRSLCGSNSNPSVNQFIGAYKTCIINGLAQKDLKKGNCEADNAIILSNLQALFSCHLIRTHGNLCPISSNDQSVQTLIDQSSEPVEDSTELPDDWSSTAYVSGFIARRIIKNNHCSSCKDALLSQPNNEMWCTGLGFKEYSDGYQRLTYPSEGLVRSVGISATLLEQKLDEQVSVDRAMETIINIIFQEVSFDWIHYRCSIHSLDVVSKIAKSVCKIGIPWWCKKKNRSMKEI